MIPARVCIDWQGYWRIRVSGGAWLTKKYPDRATAAADLERMTGKRPE